MMNLTKDKIIQWLIVLSGIVLFPSLESKGEIIVTNRFNYSHEAIFFLIVGIFGGILLFNFNKLIAALSVLLSLGVFKTFILQEAPIQFLYDSILQGFGMFFVYYFLRQIGSKEDLLKWFLIPSYFNILIIFVQRFDNHILFFLPFDSITGLIGNPGMSAGYIALTTPIILRHHKIMIIPAFIAMILCNASVAFVAAIAGGLIYLFYENKKLFKFGILAVLLFSILFVLTINTSPYKGEMKFRLSMIAGTANGVMHNPVLGWGVGSFLPIMSMVKPEDSIYIGTAFNTENAVMNHPHNELLSGAWKVGLGFPILIILIASQKILYFSAKNILPFAVLVSGAVYSTGYFFTLPLCLIFFMALAIYENQGG